MVARMTAAVERLKLLWWALLVASAIVLAWTGWEAPVYPVDGVGVGHLWWDYAAIAALWMAVLVTGVRRALAPAHENPLIAAGQWVGMAALALLSGRLTWVAVVAGDPRLSWTMLICLYSLSLMIWLDSAGHLSDELHDTLGPPSR